jgi:hypothetical protein
VRPDFVTSPGRCEYEMNFAENGVSEMGQRNLSSFGTSNWLEVNLKLRSKNSRSIRKTQMKPAAWGRVNKRMTRYEAAGSTNSGEAPFNEHKPRYSSDSRRIFPTHLQQLVGFRTKTGPAVPPVNIQDCT